MLRVVRAYAGRRVEKSAGLKQKSIGGSPGVDSIVTAACTMICADDLEQNEYARQLPPSCRLAQRSHYKSLPRFVLGVLGDRRFVSMAQALLQWPFEHDHLEQHQ
jgi:hypothetical protein